MPRLIVNADDLGLTEGVNRAIFRACREGVVTSATLMANAPAFDDAVSALRNFPQYREGSFAVGCHIVLIDGVPLSSPASIPSLVNPSTGHFHRKLWKFALSASLARISAREVEFEAAAQIQRLQQAGISVSHVDCHKHSHMFPAVLEGVLRAASAAGIRAIRNPFEPGFARPMQVARNNRLRSAETALLSRLYARRFRGTVQRHGMATTDGSLGVTATGTLDAQQFAATIAQLPHDGTYEFVCHPGYKDAALSAAHTRLLESREVELAVLCSPETRRALEMANVQLMNFADLVSESNPAPSHPMP